MSANLKLDARKTKTKRTLDKTVGHDNSKLPKFMDIDF